MESFCLRLRVQGLGFRAWGVGFRVQCFWYLVSVEGLRSRVQGLEFEVWGLGFRIMVSGFSFRFRV